uniref:LIM zinc-binding domain-containing protein n=1 Tax=Schistosoma curassoni TaxID=6186 RepID=A0A183JTV4_9TREM
MSNLIDYLLSCLIYTFYLFLKQSILVISYIVVLDVIDDKMDLVFRIRSRTFHLDCFRCVICEKLLQPGEEIAYRNEQVYCLIHSHLIQKFPKINHHHDSSENDNNNDTTTTTINNNSNNTIHTDNNNNDIETLQLMSNNHFTNNMKNGNHNNNNGNKNHDNNNVQINNTDPHNM